MRVRPTEDLARGLPWPSEEVIGLHDEVLRRLEARGMADAADKAYSGVMAAGSVFSAVEQPCPSADVVLQIIEMGERTLGQMGA